MGAPAIVVADERAAVSGLVASDRARRSIVSGAAVVVLALCLVLHVYRLSATPGWDPQEGYNLDIAWNLAHGHLRLFALSSAFAQHPPLFYLQLALSIHIFGYGVAAVRALAALYAVLTCAALLALGRRLLGAGPALWAGLVFTVAPIMLANTRWGYTYAQLAFVGLLCLWAAWRFVERPHDTRWLVLAAALAGLAAFSDYEGIAWVLFVALVALRRGWRSSVLAAGVGLAVLALGLLICFAAAPAVFAADFTSTFSRAGGGNLILQTVRLLVNYYRLVTLDGWLTLGLAGLFLVPARVRGFVLGAFAALALVALKVRDIGLSIHTLVPLLPLLALGIGLAIHLAVRRLYAWALVWLAPLLAGSGRGAQSAGEVTQQTASRRVRFAAAALVFVAVVSPVGLALAVDAAGLSSSLATRQDTILATPADAQETTTFVLAHARPGDLVLASPELAWAFDHPDSSPSLRGADLLQTVAQSGQAASFYPDGLPASRWSDDLSLSHARYVIMDDLLRQLAAPGQVGALNPLLTQVERWPVVYQRGQYTVYERPGTP
jgi:4-amino-4-deoxy-L-arabinose transferase-like glycosyltransferase